MAKKNFNIHFNVRLSKIKGKIINQQWNVEKLDKFVLDHDPYSHFIVLFL